SPTLRHRLARCSVGPSLCSCFFFFNAPSTPDIYTLSLHDALPISRNAFPINSMVTLWMGSCMKMESWSSAKASRTSAVWQLHTRSEEHTSELQSRFDLVCRLLLEKKKSTSRASTSLLTRR